MRAVWAGAISPAPLFHQPLGKFSKIVGHEVINRRRDHHIQSISSNDVCLSEASDYLPDAKQSIHHHRPTFLQGRHQPRHAKMFFAIVPQGSLLNDGQQHLYFAHIPCATGRQPGVRHSGLSRQPQS